MTLVTPLFSAAAGKITATTVAAGILRLRIAAAASAATILRLRKLTLSGREKLIHRELEVLEQGAGIFGRACTLLLRHAEIVCGHEQLYIALQADNAELTKGHQQLPAVTGNGQIVIETAANVGRNIHGTVAVSSSPRVPP